MNRFASWLPNMPRPLKLLRLLRCSAVGNLCNTGQKPAVFVAVAMDFGVKLKTGDRRQHVALGSVSVYPTPVPTPVQAPMAIGKATNVAIDDTILKRMLGVMPSYQSRKAFINQLLDEAITLREELMSRNPKPVAE